MFTNAENSPVTRRISCIPTSIDRHNAPSSQYSVFVIVNFDLKYPVPLRLVRCLKSIFDVDVITRRKQQGHHSLEVNMVLLRRTVPYQE